MDLYEILMELVKIFESQQEENILFVKIPIKFWVCQNTLQGMAIYLKINVASKTIMLCLYHFKGFKLGKLCPIYNLLQVAKLLFFIYNFHYK